MYYLEKKTKKNLKFSTTSRTDVRQRCPFKVTELYLGDCSRVLITSQSATFVFHHHMNTRRSLHSSLHHKYHYDNYITDKKLTVRISGRASWCASRITRKYYIYVRGATWGGQDVRGRGRSRDEREREREREKWTGGGRRSARSRRMRRRTRRSTCDLCERRYRSDAPMRKICRICRPGWLTTGQLDQTLSSSDEDRYVWETGRYDWPRSGLLSGPSRSANGTATAKPFTHKRSRSCRRGGNDTYGGYCSSNVTFPVVNSRRREKKRHPQGRCKTSRSPVIPIAYYYSSLTFYIRIEVSYAHTHTYTHTEQTEL